MLSWLISAAAAATLADVHLPPTMSVGGRELELVACGVRDTLWIDHYVAGLYVPKGESPRTAKDGRRPKAVRMQVVQSAFLPSSIPERWRRALQSELAQEPMQRVRRAYARLGDGDVVIFGYVPEEGVTMQVNGTLVVRAPGHALIDSILHAWAGKDAISGKLQRLALEHPC